MFSYNDYGEIIEAIKATGLQATFRQAIERDRFILSRHDVEYSVERALHLAKIEEQHDFNSTFFFQWTNNSYNILSKRNQVIVREIHERGHEIGLHFALNGLTDMEQIRKQIEKEVRLLSEMFGFTIQTFSIHRPSKEVLRENIKIPGLLNTYQDDFFTFDENVDENSVLNVKYFSDANHIWRYGYPSAETMQGLDRIQILTHPFAWTQAGYDNFNNYRSLIGEKEVELVESINAECKDFIEYQDYFLNRAVYRMEEES